MSQRAVIFIHGMFLTGKCWEPWLPIFERQGYRCLDADWPLHAADPVLLRESVPPGTGELSLDTVVAHFEQLAASEQEKPILVGHSVGGLIVQLLAARGLAAAGVCVSSVAPNRMLSVDWHFFKNSLAITNPLKGNQPYPMTPEGFHANFCNTLSRAESDAIYAEQAVHESRNVLRDCMGPSGHIDFKNARHAPLLFVSGDQDHIIPAKLDAKNAEVWREAGAIVEFRQFPGHGHYIIGEPGWQEVAEYSGAWLAQHAPAEVPVAF